MHVYEKGQIVAARYRLERALAQGGMGSVWVAHHLQLDVPVAIKFMAPEFVASSELRARFEREARAAAQLKSPHAVQIHDYGIEDDAPYIVMELLEGEDLSARLARTGRLSLATTQGLIAQIGKALRRAHAIGLVHRDLKPANIFLSTGGGEEIVKLVDFGIAKAMHVGNGEEATQTGALLGSPRYMSPEQVRSSAHVDPRSDLWSLAVIAFRCLTGELPFPGGEPGEIFIAICTAAIPRPSDVAPELGPEIDAFFARALERPLERRFQTAAEFVDAFTALPTTGDPAATGRLHGRSLGEVEPTHPARSTLVSSYSRSSPQLRTTLALLGGAALVIGLVTVFVLRGPTPTETTTAPSPTPAPIAAPAASPPIAAPMQPPAADPMPAPASPPVSKPRRTAPATKRRGDDLLKHM